LFRVGPQGSNGTALRKTIEGIVPPTALQGALGLVCSESEEKVRFDV
jgi:hypothetical protein